MNCICCGTSFDALNESCPHCQWDPDATHDLTGGYDVGDIIKGRYKVKQHLGVGRLGVAIKAHDIKKSRSVVVKLIHPGLLPDNDTRDHFVAAMKPFINVEHPHAAHLFDVVKDRRKVFVVREFLTGVTLAQLMKDQKILGQVFPNDEAVQIIKDLSNAFAATWGAHGLFSPSKVWAMPSDIKVVDCGIPSALPPDALWHVARKTKMSRFVAPELTDNRPPDPTSDVYSLGVVLGEMLSLAEYAGDVAVFRENQPNFSMEVEALVRCALSLDPEARYKDVLEFVSALFDITGRKRTSMMPPDNTAVVPFRFLNELRSMSVVPPPSEELDDFDDSPVPSIFEDELDDADLEYDDDSLFEEEPNEHPEVITRQVAAASITQENPNAGDARVTPVPEPPETTDVEKEDIAVSARPTPIPPMMDDGSFSSFPAAPITEVSRSKPLPLVPKTSGDSESSIPPLPLASPRPSASPPVPRPSNVTVPRPSAPPVPKPSSVAPIPIPGSVSVPTPSVSSELVKNDEENDERLEGINPRFLRAAAKLEEARISQAQPNVDTPSDEEEEWRKRLEESTSGSVISFLPPTDMQENPQPVQGFPENKQPQQPQIPPVPKSGVKPPPLPPRRK